MSFHQIAYSELLSHSTMHFYDFLWNPFYIMGVSNRTTNNDWCIMASTTTSTTCTSSSSTQVCTNIALVLCRYTTLDSHCFICNSLYQRSIRCLFLFVIHTIHGNKQVFLCAIEALCVYFIRYTSLRCSARRSPKLGHSMRARAVSTHSTEILPKNSTIEQFVPSYSLPIGA